MERQLLQRGSLTHQQFAAGFLAGNCTGVLFLCPNHPPCPCYEHSCSWCWEGSKTSLIEGDEKQELSESVVCSGWAVIPSGKADAVPDLTL